MPEYDFGSVPDADEGINTLPFGKYLCRLLEKTVDQAQQTGNYMWRFRFDVLDGPHRGQYVYDSVTWTPEAMKRVKLVLKRLGVPVDGKVNTDALVMEGRIALITLAQDVYTNPATGAKREQIKVPFAGVEEPTPENLAQLGFNTGWAETARAENAKANAATEEAVRRLAGTAWTPPAVPPPQGAAPQQETAAVAQVLPQAQAVPQAAAQQQAVPAPPPASAPIPTAQPTGRVGLPF